MLKNTRKLVIFMLLAIAFFALANFVLAAEADLGMEYGDEIGLSDEDPRIIVARVIQVALGFLGITAVIIIMYAGWVWMTSEGNEEKISQAKKILTNAIIGLVIVLSAFSIASFILSRLTGAVNGENFYPNSGGAPSGGGVSATTNKIIESHYPSRNQVDVPRNTKIMVTFKEAIDINTIITQIEDPDDEKNTIDVIQDNNIKIYKSVDGADNALSASVVLATKTSDDKTFVFNTTSLFDMAWYTISLGAGITKSDGSNAFIGEMSTDGYSWSFEVSADEDLIPPKIREVVPSPSTTKPRNSVIQINFNEPVDPTMASGSTGGGFDNIEVRDNSAALVEGNFYISNGYKTVEFLTVNTCGVNSCGQTVYCLPANQTLTVLVKAANISTGLNGIADMAGNSLDGNADGLSQGPGADDYSWSFSTTNEIIITSPEIIEYGPMGAGTSLDAVPYAIFNRILLSSSLVKDDPVGSGGVSLTANPTEKGIYYQINKRNDSVIIDEQEVERTIVYIRHGQNFYEDTDYTPEFNQNIRDIYQNCYSYIP